MLIDWVTLRFPLDKLLLPLWLKIEENMNTTNHILPSGEILWTKRSPNWEEIRSDMQGLYFSVTSDGDSVRYITIGGSPSSIENSGLNVFGTFDLQTAAEILLNFAEKSLKTKLPSWKFWQCRRIDITGNFDLGNFAQVKQVLHLLLSLNGSRKTAKSAGDSDTVMWNSKSDLRSGKAYHKGPQLRVLARKGKIAIEDSEIFALADRLIRFELKLGSRWFRRLSEGGINWFDLSSDELLHEFENYFGELIGDSKLEVFDMGTLLIELQKITTEGRAASALRTWSLIKQLGFVQAKESMRRGTFDNHLSLLRKAGLSNSDLRSAQIIPFKKRAIVLSNPVLSWDELRKVA